MMLALSAVSLLIWLYLVLLHGRFWQAGPVLAPLQASLRPDASTWPALCVVVPARDEAEHIEEALRSLLDQDYPGPYGIVLVDDRSSDTTASLARGLASPHLEVVEGGDTPANWSGKLWAVAQGVHRAQALMPGEDGYILLADADIVHDPRHAATLVAKAMRDGLDQVSEMVVLSTATVAERALVPAFVYFFQLLYPFAWVNQPARRTAAAAGGTVLIRRTALARIGGIESLRSALIDDVTLAGKVKRSGGAIWLGHSVLARSIRPYPRPSDIWRMVARTAYVQLRFSPLLLLGTVLAMLLVWVMPVVAMLSGGDLAELCGLIAWIVATMSFLPTLRRFRVSPFWALLMPLVALFYMAATIGSALDHYRGRGVVWKQRAYRQGEFPVSMKDPGRELDAMNELSLDVASGKGRADENFPVGSRLIRASDRPHVHAYYGFARAIDDIADNNVLSPEAKVARLDAMEAMLLGRPPGPGSPATELAKALRLRDSLAITGIDPATGTDLVVAFRQDAVKHRYESWDELALYCRYSAAPVGRYLLLLHGEELRGPQGAALLAASDALCAALQVLNHLQDCASDLALLDRCYIPLPWLAEAGLGVAVLRGARSPPGLRRVLDRLLDAVDGLNRSAEVLPSLIADRRMRLEAAVIVGLSHRLASRLRSQDPLAGRVTLRRPDIALSLLAAARHFRRR